MTERTEPNREGKMVITDGKYIGFLKGHYEPWSKVVSLTGALEIVTAVFPIQTPQGMGQIVSRSIQSLAMTLGPKEITTCYSQILFVESDLDAEEQKAVVRVYVEATESLKKQRMQRETGLIV